MAEAAGSAGSGTDMTLAEFLAACMRSGITIERRGKTVRLTTKNGVAPPPELLTQAKRLKADLLEWLRARAAEARKSYSQARFYRVDSRTGAILWRRKSRDLGDDDDLEIPLANFSARITTDIIEDDGTPSPARTYALEVTLGPQTRELTVVAERFAGMAWVHNALGARAIITPGQGMTDQLRAAIQHLSPSVKQERRFIHTGWRELDGGAVYMHAGGAIGAAGAVSGLEVVLRDELGRYRLPDPPADPAAIERAVRASLGILSLGPITITGPGLAYTYRAAISRTDYSLGYVGRSGAGKSSLTALYEQHFGPGMAFPFFPTNWTSTANTIAELQFACKDALLAVDDYVPAGSTQDRQRLQGQAARVIRGQANYAGRGRMRRDGTLAPVHRPRGSVIWTGEDALLGESLQVRSLTCGCYRGMLDSAILVQCRADAEAGLYAQAMAAFIHWQAAQRDQVLAQLAGETRTIRQTLEMDGHPKTPDILADLAAGWQAFLRFAVERAGIPQTEAAELGARMNGALRELGAEQAQALVAAEPAGRSITLLRAAVAGARAHLTHLDTNRRPPNALQHGWRVHTSHSEDDEGRSSTRTEVRAEGDHLGYVDGQGEIYLEPAIAYKMAVRLANDEGDTLGVGFITWKKRLHEQKFLAEIRRDRGQLHLDVRKTVGGKRRPVLHIRAIAWNPSDEPEPPPADETPPSDEEPADASPGKPPPGPDKDSPVGGLCTGINSRANRAKNDDSPDLSTSGAWPCNDPVALERGPEDDFRATQEPLKNNADRANWPSWPSKITQYTSPLAENVEEAPKPAAWRGAGPFMAGAAVAGFRVVIARGQPVLEGRGDTQEEQALIRDLRAHQAELQAMLGRPPCHACKGLEWWVSTAGGVFCRRCKPPILDRLVAMRFKTEQEGAEDRHGRGET